jgi:hypothetical protein
MDVTQWLKSRGRIVELDELGNEIEHSFTDPQVYFEPVTEYGYKPKDPKKSRWAQVKSVYNCKYE